MKVERIINSREKAYDFILIKDNKKLCICFYPNLDLYMLLNDDKRIKYNENKTIDFEICSDDGIIFDLFNTLYSDIIIGNVFGYKDSRKNKMLDSYIREPYSRLVDKNNNICWISDDGICEAMDRVILSKTHDNTIKLTFIRNNIRDEFGFKNPNAITVRFRNSGSKYDPFNCVFMRLYQKMQIIDIELLNDEKKYLLEK